jgi:hypothetical protein
MTSPAELAKRLRKHIVRRWTHSTGETPRSDGYCVDKDCAAAADMLEQIAGANAAMPTAAVQYRWNHWTSDTPWEFAQPGYDAIENETVTDHQLVRRFDALAAIAAVQAQLLAAQADAARFVPLRAKGVIDADNNLDCWDTPPFDICHAHVEALNEKDPASMWQVVDLYARETLAIKGEAT